MPAPSAEPIVVELQGDSMSPGLPRGCRLLVCGLNSQPGSLLYRSGFVDDLGDDNVCPDLTHALQRAHSLLPDLMGGDET